MPPPSPPPNPSTPPPAPPDAYKYWRCYMQRGGKKYVRTYSEHADLLTSGIQGTCSLDVDFMFHCGNSCSQCKGGPDGSDDSHDPGALGNEPMRLR